MSDRSMTDQLRALAGRDPTAMAVIDRDRAVTFGELDLLARRMAAYLERQGLRPGDMAGITVRAGLAHVVTSLGLMRLGCDQIVLASHDTGAMRADLARRVRAAAIIGDRPEDAIEGVGFFIPDHAAVAADRSLDDGHIPAAGPDGTTLLLASSGTTGRPKIIPLTERLLLLRARIAPDFLDSRLIPLSIEFQQSRLLTMLLLAGGRCTVFDASSDSAQLVEALRRFDVGHVTLAPHRVETLLREVDRIGPWPARTRLYLTGAPVPGALRARIQAGLTRNVHVYHGAAECGFISLAYPDDHALHPDGVGRAYKSEVMVTDDAGRRLPPGEPGLLRVLSAGTVPGYLDDPEANARTFLPGGWYQPGDVATMTPDGHILLAERGDDMMILGTINVFPAEIEHAAAGFPGLADCAAFARRSGAHGDIPMIAAVETHPGALDPAALIAHCRTRLGLRAPRKAIIVPVLPRNAAGKVLRQDLASIAAAEMKAS